MSTEKNIDDYTRVTTVLYPFSGLEKIDGEIVRHAGERGTKVHKICEGIMSGLGEIGVDEETEPYVESFKKWWGDGKQIVEMEKRFYCESLGITGQVDIIIQTEDGMAIVDLKTSYKPSKTWQVQGSGYYYLVKDAGYDIKKLLFLHLQRNGKPAKVIEYPCDPQLFLQVYSTYKHFYEPYGKTK